MRIALLAASGLAMLPCEATAQQLVANGTTQTAVGTIDTGLLGPTAGYALYALNSGIILNSSPLTLRTGGATANAVQAASGGSITISSGSQISTSGNAAIGAFATGVGSSITATNTSISTATANAHGVEATLGASVTLSGGSVTVIGSQAKGLFAFAGAGSPTVFPTIIANNVAIKTSGSQGNGVEANVAGRITLTGGTVETSGASAIGLFTIDGNAILRATDTRVTTTGDNAYAASALGGQIFLTNASLSTAGTGAAGARVDNQSALTMQGGSILTTGPSAFGMLSTARSTLTADGVGLTTSGAGSPGASAQFGGQLLLSNSTVRTTGDSSVGLFSVGVQTVGALVSATSVDLQTTGVNSHGASVRGGSTIQIIGSSIRASGAGAAALFSSPFEALPSTATITNSTFAATQGAGILVNGLGAGAGRTLNATIVNSSVSGGPNLFEVVNTGSLSLSADGSALTGGALTDATSTSNVTLKNATLWNLTGSGTVTTIDNQNSTINFGAPVGDPSLSGSYKTLLANSYAASNGTIGLNTYLAGDGAPSDRLVINGGSATGNSLLRITNTTGPGALTNGNGILLVEATGAATTAAGAFSLSSALVAGPYEYSLYRGSSDASAPESWYLRSDLTPVPPTPPGPGPGPAPPASGIPDYRRETSLYAALPTMGLLYGRTIIDSLHERIGEQRPGLDGGLADPGRSSLSLGWGRIIGAHGNRDGGPWAIYRNGPNYDYDIGALQLGLDLYRAYNADGSRDHAGIYGVIGRIQGDVSHFNRINAGTNTIKGYTVGAYWTHFGASGWYLDGVAQGTWFDAEADSKRLFKLDRNGFGFGASVEGGYPIALGQGWTLEPQAQMIYQTLVNSSGNDGAALVRFSDVNSLAGRIGTRLAKSWALDEGARPRMMTAWLKLSLWNEFLGDPKTSFSSATGPITFHSDLGGSWLEARAGLDAQVARNTSLYASAGYSVGTEGRSHAYDGRIGLRLTW